MNFHESFILGHHPASQCRERLCQRAFYAKGLCKKHYYRWKKGTFQPSFDPSEVTWRTVHAN